MRTSISTKEELNREMGADGEIMYLQMNEYKWFNTKHCKKGVECLLPQQLSEDLAAPILDHKL